MIEFGLPLFRHTPKYAMFKLCGALVAIGDAEKQIGVEEMKFVAKTQNQVLRLDLDAAKANLKTVKTLEGRGG